MPWPTTFGSSTDSNATGDDHTTGDGHSALAELRDLVTRVLKLVGELEQAQEQLEAKHAEHERHQ